MFCEPLTHRLKRNVELNMIVKLGVFFTLSCMWLRTGLASETCIGEMCNGFPVPSDYNYTSFSRNCDQSEGRLHGFFPHFLEIVLNNYTLQEASPQQLKSFLASFPSTKNLVVFDLMRPLGHRVSFFSVEKARSIINEKLIAHLEFRHLERNMPKFLLPLLVSDIEKESFSLSENVRHGELGVQENSGSCLILSAKNLTVGISKFGTNLFSWASNFHGIAKRYQGDSTRVPTNEKASSNLLVCQQELHSRSGLISCIRDVLRSMMSINEFESANDDLIQAMAKKLFRKRPARVEEIDHLLKAGMTYLQADGRNYVVIDHARDIHDQVASSNILCPYKWCQWEQEKTIFSREILVEVLTQQIYASSFVTSPQRHQRMHVVKTDKIEFAVNHMNMSCENTQFIHFLDLDTAITVIACGELRCNGGMCPTSILFYIFFVTWIPCIYMLWNKGIHWKEYLIKNDTRIMNAYVTKIIEKFDSPTRRICERCSSIRETFNSQTRLHDNHDDSKPALHASAYETQNNNSNFTKEENVYAMKDKREQATYATGNSSFSNKQHYFASAPTNCTGPQYAERRFSAQRSRSSNDTHTGIKRKGEDYAASSHVSDTNLELVATKKAKNK